MALSNLERIAALESALAALGLADDDDPDDPDAPVLAVV